MHRFYQKDSHRENLVNVLYGEPAALLPHPAHPAKLLLLLQLDVHPHGHLLLLQAHLLDPFPIFATFTLPDFIEAA